MNASRIQTARARMKRTILVSAKGNRKARKRYVGLANEARRVLDTSGRNRVNNTKNWVESYMALRS